MPRTARLDAPGTLHHVIVRGIERRQIIDDNEDRNSFEKRMGHLAIETKTVIYAWALLNNHAQIQKVCETESINLQELISGSRRRHIASVRSRLAVKLVEGLGISLAETARQLGVSTSAISKIMRKYAECPDLI